MLTNNFLIADDHEIFRCGTAEVLKKLIPDIVIYEASNCEQLSSLLSTHEFNLVILGIDMPGSNTLKMIDSIKSKGIKTRILVSSLLDERIYAVRYIRSGANGYFSKSGNSEELKNAIQTVLDDHQYLSNNIKEHLLASVINKKPSADNLLDTLSAREKEVAGLLAIGKGPQHISSALQLHISSVGTYKNRIFKKLNISNIIELGEIMRLYNQ